MVDSSQRTQLVSNVGGIGRKDPCVVRNIHIVQMTVPNGLADGGKPICSLSADAITYQRVHVGS